MILGLACGLLLRLLPQEVNGFITHDVASPVLNILLKVISGVVGPVLFFSLVSSTIALAGVNELTGLGFKIIRRFLLIILFLIVVSVLVCGLIFRNFGAADTSFSLGQLFTMILDIIPTNLTDTDEMDITVTALDESGDEIISKTFSDVTIKAGYKTTYHGEFFTTKRTTAGFTVNDWSEFDTVEY